MLNTAVLNLESVDEILNCNLLSNTYVCCCLLPLSTVVPICESVDEIGDQ